MKRSQFTFAVFGLLGALTAMGCGESEQPVNRVNVNVVDKEILDGSWYYHRVVVDVDYESAGFGTFQGDSSYNLTAGGMSQFSIERIRWVIDEGFLYAYRDYEIIQETTDSAIPDDDIGQPVAVFAIESHFDIKRMYSATTGEEYNVLYEDTSDARWYDRRFMRVDWSKNLISSPVGQLYQLYALFGLFVREPATLYVQNASEFPDAWSLQFHRMTCNGVDDTSAGCSEDDRPHAGDYNENELYAFDFVTQEIISPGIVPDPYTGAPVNFCLSIYSDAPECITGSIFVRNAFLKVSPRRQYEPINWTDTRFVRHGYFRLEQLTYDRSSGAGDPAFGFTDYINYNAVRHNIWQQWYNEAADGTRTPIPYADRDVRQVVWHTTPELPGHLVKPGLEVIGEWNDMFMETVRNLRGQAQPVYPAVDCQRTNPDGYCYCVDGADGAPINPTCSGIYDPFESPAAAMARGVANPFDCHIEVPAGAEPNMEDPAVSGRLTDESFYGWFDARFVGSECVHTLVINSCHKRAQAEATAAGLDWRDQGCQDRGDLRFKFLSYVDQPGTDFLGISTVRGDPVTGEIIAGDANIGGPALDSYRTRALQAYDLINGTIDENEFWVGEDIREYLETLNQVELPAPPRVDFNAALNLRQGAPAEVRAEVDARMAQAMPRLEGLRGPEGRANIMSDRLRRLAGTDIERRLLANEESMVLLGARNVPREYDPSHINESMLDAISPFRGNNAVDQIAWSSAMERAMAQHNVHMPNEFTDDSVMHFVNKHVTWPRARLEFELNRLLYFETQLHELGHTLGLRHDPGGSADSHNYHEEYYRIDAQYPLPDPTTYDRDGISGLNPTEYTRFETDYTTARRNRELAGIDLWMNSSIMEYTANWYERVTPLGSYDRAAINFGYGDHVELYDNAAGLAVNEINPANTLRTWAKYYHGGESCETDADCPYSASGRLAGELTPRNTEAGLVQRCIPAAPDGPEAGTVGHCSNYDADMNAMVTAPTDAPRYAPVNYRYCTDDHAASYSSFNPGTVGWCMYFDEGENYREIVRNIQESYERVYLFSNFRRYQSGYDIGPYIFNTLARRFSVLMNIYNTLVYRYTSDPSFRSTGDQPFGYIDQFLATADVMNFFGRVLGTPDVGAYRWDEYWQRYYRYNIDPDLTGAQLAVPIGLGRYMSSIYQTGLTGINRIERIGTIYDKFITMQLLTFRGLGAFYTPDVPMFTNFYDIFPNEMQQMFEGMIRAEPRTYMPRVQCAAGSVFPRCNDPRVIYMDFYRGDCSDPDSPRCRPNPAEVTYRDLPVLNGGGHFLMQFYGAIYALANFPVFFDTSFQNQLFICVEGTGECHRPESAAVEGVDYVRFTSPRYAKSFLAWQVEPRAGVAEQTSLGFAMVKEAADLNFILEALQRYRGDYGGAPYTLANLSAEERARLTALGYTIPTSNAVVDDEVDRLYFRVQDLESFFNQIIQLQREMGIVSFL